MSNRASDSGYSRLTKANENLRAQGGARLEVRLLPDENEALNRLTACTGEKRGELVRRLIREESERGNDGQ